MIAGTHLSGSPLAMARPAQSWSRTAVQAMRKACPSESQAAVPTDVVGSVRLEHQMPRAGSDALPARAIFIDPQTTFHCSFGEVDGSITCLSDVQEQAVMTIGFRFDGTGLAGDGNAARAKRNLPPNQGAVTFFATSLSNANGGN